MIINRRKQAKLLSPHSNAGGLKGKIKTVKAKGNTTKQKNPPSTGNTAQVIASHVPTVARASDLKLTIPTSVVSDYAAMQLEAGKNEIGGIGIVETVSEKEFRLIKLFVATSSHCGTLNVMDAAEVGSALFRASQMGLFNTDHVVFWHTHPGFGCFWSATDVNAVEEQILDGGKVINLLFSDPGKSIARFDYINNFEDFKEAHLAEEKALIKQHQEEAKAEAEEKNKKDMMLGMSLRKLLKLSDIPPYLEIVKTLAEARGLSEDTYFIRDRALQVQQHLLTVVRYNQKYPLTPEKEKQVLATEVKYKIEPIKLSEYKIKPEVVSLSMEVVLDYSYLKAELDVISNAGSSNVRNPASNVRSDYANHNAELWEDEHSWLGVQRPPGGYYEDSIKKKEGKTTKVTPAERAMVLVNDDAYDMSRLHIKDEDVIKSVNRLWQMGSDVRSIDVSCSVNPPALPGVFANEKNFIRLFKLPAPLLDYHSVEYLDDFLMWLLSRESTFSSEFYLEVVTKPVINYNIDNVMTPVENLGEWMFGPSTYQPQYDKKSVSVCTSVGFMTLRYLACTPPEGIKLLDSTVENFFSICEQKASIVREMLEYIEAYYPIDVAVDHLSQLNEVIAGYGLKDTEGNPMDCIDFLSTGSKDGIVSILDEFEFNEALDYQHGILVDEECLLSPDFAESQRVIAALLK